MVKSIRFDQTKEATILRLEKLRDDDDEGSSDGGPLNENKCLIMGSYINLNIIYLMAV